MLRHIKQRIHLFRTLKLNNVTLVINDFYKSRLKKSLKEKLKFKGYETDFQWCEYKRSDSPLAFDNKW